MRGGDKMPRCEVCKKEYKGPENYAIQTKKGGKVINLCDDCYEED